MFPDVIEAANFPIDEDYNPLRKYLEKTEGTQIRFREKDRDNFFALNKLDPFMAGHKGFICGGCFKNLFNGEKIKDVDIFFENEADWQSAVEFYDKECDEGTVIFLYENDNVKAYVHESTGIRIELCRRIFGTPEQIIGQFDFTITKVAYFKKEAEDKEGNGTHIEYALLLHPDFFEHLHTKRLVIDNNIPFPMSTLERIFRYIKYGYGPCKETKIKIAKAIHDLSPEQIEVSQDLYNGMD